METRSDTRRRIFAIVGASSGNLVEWFDFYGYSFCAIYFAPAFFPNGNRTTQLLNAAGVFAAGFLMRPIGGWLFGRIADRRGIYASFQYVTLIGGQLLAVSTLFVLQQFLSVDELRSRWQACTPRSAV